MKRTTLSTTIAAAVVTTMLLASCGPATVEVHARADTGDPAGATTVADAPSTTIAGTVESTTTTPATTQALATSSTTTAPAPDGTGRSVEAFCAAAGETVDDGLGRIVNSDIGDFDAESMMDTFKRTMNSVADAMARMDRVAPPEIAEDMHTLATQAAQAAKSIQSAQSLRDLWGSSDAVGSVDSTSASLHVAEYTLEHCGFSIEGTARN